MTTIRAGRLMPRTLVSVTAGALALALLPGAAASQESGAAVAEHACPADTDDYPGFDDVVGNAHEHNIRCMLDLGLTVGLAGGQAYGPRRDMTRGQMASFVARWIEHYVVVELGQEGFALDEGSERFDDVPSGNVHAESIHKLAEIGVTVGLDEDEFAPLRLVTRAQMASFIARASSYIADETSRPEHQPPRSDTAHFDVGGPHADNVDALAEAGIVEGFADGQYRPGHPVKRDQMASFVMRAYGWALMERLGEDPPPPDASGGVEQVAVTGSQPGATVVLHGPDGGSVAEGTADDAGSHLFREVQPAEGYRVRQIVEGARSRRSAPVEVTSPDDVPPQSLYDDQRLEPGYGYLEVRDGTTLGYQLLLPDEEEFGPGPYPAVIDYSGYEPSHNIYDGLDDDFLDLGYAVLGVNMRGTGCSGGAFDYFEWQQALDGYDMVEVVAAQDWSDGVGLVGKSYPGISQLFVAATQPPSLDAIAPGHVVGDFYRDVVYPGGMLNQTYAVQWAFRQDAIADYPSWYGWVQERVEDGDEVCEANQRLRGQSVDLLELLPSNPVMGETWERIAPHRIVGDIEVPTMLVNAWQDDTTGGRPAVLMEHFDPDTEVRFVGSNGDHGEYYGPAVFGDVERFLAYHLRGEIPAADEAGYDTFEEAYAAYQAEDRATIHWEIGAAGGRVPAETSTFEAWPIPEVEPWRLHLQPDGSLGADAPAAGADPAHTAYDDVPPDEAMYEGDWPHPAEGTAAVWTSEALAEDEVLAGSASVDLWLAADAADTDLEVVLSEVRPDGEEMFVQTGWLRASHRAEDPDASTELRPHHRHTADALQELQPGEFEEVRVELFPFAHTFREGSAIRISVEPPGGNRTRWAFDVVSHGETNRIAHTEARPSSVALPRVPGLEREAGLPDCGTVRSQPCRDASHD